MNTASIQSNITRIRKQICEEEVRYHRQPGSVQLLAVSKYHSLAAIEAAHAAGIEQFAESQVQVALDKMERCTASLTWHFIGGVQANKTKAIAEHFAWVHSLAREKIARRLSEQRLAVSEIPLNVCIQVNISNEPQKSGVSEEAVLPLAEQVMALPGLRLRGLMAIPRSTKQFAEQRAQFRRLAALYQQLQAQGYCLDTLSMGMSADWPAAVAEGATMIRVGTDIFGKKQER